MEKFSTKFIIGIILLVTNQPIGWAGLIACAYIAKKTKKKIFYAAGTLIYVLSWGMVAAGLALCGPEGLKLVWGLYKRHGKSLAILIAVMAVIALYAAKLKYGIQNGKIGSKK